MYTPSTHKSTSLIFKYYVPHLHCLRQRLEKGRQPQSFKYKNTPPAKAEFAKIKRRDPLHPLYADRDKKANERTFHIKERQAEMVAHFFAELGCKIGDELTMPGSEFGPGKDGMKKNDEAGWKVMDFLMRRSKNGEYVPAARLNAPSILDGLDRDEFRTVSIEDLIKANPHLRIQGGRETVSSPKPENILH